MNIKLNLQFDGTAYHGWQIQDELATVQGTVRDAWHRATGEAATPDGCGRTDAGVHGMDYVCNIHSKTTIPIERIPHALNTYLPDDIVCTNAERVSDDFCSARSAVKKTYRYTIDNGTFPDVFSGRFAWHYKYPLDIEAMRSAADGFIGTHDFISFARSGFTVKTTVRTIYAIKIEKNGNIISIDVTGNGFLYNMVRIIAGTLVYAGSGKINPCDIPNIIASKDRKRAGITAPPHGLCLKEVFY